MIKKLQSEFIRYLIICIVLEFKVIDHCFIEMENHKGCLSPDDLLSNDLDSINLGQASKSPPKRNQIVQRLHQNISQMKPSQNRQLPNIYEIKKEINNENQEEIGITFGMVRQFCEKVCASPSFYYFLLVTLFVFLFACLTQDRRKTPTLCQVSNYIELSTHIIFLILLIPRLLAQKKEKPQKPIWLILDAVSIISGVCGCLISDPEISRYLKAIRTIKLLFIIKEIEILCKPASDLMNALAKVGNILIPAIVIIYVYAVVGLYTFSDFQYNRCRVGGDLNHNSSWIAYDKEVYLCGEKPCPESYTCLNPIDYNMPPSQKQLINIIQGNNLMKYSNIFYAILSTFKQTFVTGSSRLIILYKQVLNPIFIQVYFYSYIYLISYIYLNIFYSLIITEQWDGDQLQDSKQGKSAVKDGNEEKEDETIKTLRIQYYVDDEEEKNNPKNSEQKDNNDNAQLASQTKEINLNDYNQDLPDAKDEKDNKTTGIRICGSFLVRKNAKKDIKSNNLAETPSLKSDSRHRIQVKKARIFNIFEHIEQPQELKVQKQLSQIPNQIQMQAKSSSLHYQVLNNIIILLSCINLSLDFHGQTPKFKFVVDCIDFGFFCLLVIQAVTKVLAQKFKKGALQLGTKLDVCIMCLCACGVIYEAATAQDLNDFFAANASVEGIFRSFKYLRLMVLILSSNIFKQARLIFQSIFRSLYTIRHMILVWIVIVLTFSITGYNLHSYKTKQNKQTMQLDLQNGQEFQISFDGIYQSIIYTLLTFYNEEWDYIMFQQYLGGGALLVVWQLLSICVGLLLFSKYFMALLMRELDGLIDNSGEVLGDEVNSDKQSQVNEEQNSEVMLNSKITPLDQVHRMQKKRIEFLQPPKKILRAQAKISAQLGSRQHCIKKVVHFLRTILEHRYYKILFGVFIALSCLVLVSTHPHADRNSSSVRGYLILNIVNKCFFIADLFFNLMVFGLFQEESSYLRKSWLNWLNILIIIFQIASFPTLTTSFIFQKLQKIQVLRTLYYLQFRYKHDWNMRITYHSFVQLLPKVFTLLIITLLMYSYFALVLVKLYKDDFYTCIGSSTTNSITNYQDCLLLGGDWIQQSINVGNILDSTLFLFFVATMEGWISLLYPTMNLAGKDMNPLRDANKYISIFFVFFFFFGNLIMLNVFIGLSVSNFKRLKDKTTGESKLNKKQKEWLSVKSQIYRLNPQQLQTRSSNVIRGYAYDIANHCGFKIVQGFFFCAFLITMSLFESNMSDQKEIVLKYIQYFFVTVLICQDIIEFLAFGIRNQYKKSLLFKFFVIVYSIIYVIINESMQLNKYDSRILGGTFIALQFIRYLALLDQIPFAKKLLNTIVSVLPQTSNILLMICLTLFIYAIIGMELFSFLKPSIELDTFNQNYTNFSTALFALIKFSTLESPIQQIADAAQQMTPNFICSPIYTYEDYLLKGQMGCGNQIMSYIFFLSFHIFYSMLLMSTVMAVIVDSYSDVKREEEAPITKLVLEKVRSAWAKIDPQATGYIPYRQFWMFTAKLLEIYMGKEKANNSISALFSSKEEFLKKMAIPIYENENGVLCFQFNEVIEALTRIYMENNFGTIISKKVQKMFKQRQSVISNGFNKSFYTSSHVATLIILKSGLRTWKKMATNQTGIMDYKNVISKFNKQMIDLGGKSN